MVRPSYVLGGRAMEIVYSDQDIHRYINTAVEVDPDRPVLVDKYLDRADELDVDALAGGCREAAQAMPKLAWRISQRRHAIGLQLAVAVRCGFLAVPVTSCL